MPDRGSLAEWCDDAGTRRVFQFYIRHVEPLFLTLLFYVNELAGEVLRAGIPTDGGSATLAGLVVVGLELHVEVLPPHAKVRRNAKEGLTKHDKA